jgi:phospholipid/cholesterol/gamma-HCH transport system substrate-binding protein
VTVVRGAALLALAVAVVIVAILLVGGNGGTEYKVRFQSATLIVKGNDVQVGGHRVGSVKSLGLTDDNQAELTIKVEKPFAPLHEGTTAIIRQTSLSGVANRYVALTPGPNNAAEIPDGGVIRADRTTSPVSLDQLFNTLDPTTRRDLQNVVQGSARQYAGRGREGNEGFKYFSPAISSTARLAQQLNADTPALTDFLVNSSRLVTTIAARRDDLANLVSNANTTAAAIGSEDQSLSRALAALPSTLRRANTTFVNLRATLDDLDPLVAASKPATRRLAPFLRELRPLVANARPTIRDLNLLLRRPGANNDAVELVRKAPRLASVATPTFAHSVDALRQTQPVLDFLRPYAPDFIMWLRDFGQGASNYDANGHFARIQPLFHGFTFADSPSGGVLTPAPRSTRLEGLTATNNRRCPGAASQSPPDNSAPFRDLSGTLDCDPGQVPPGP